MQLHDTAILASRCVLQHKTHLQLELIQVFVIFEPIILIVKLDVIEVIFDLIIIIVVVIKP